MYLCLTLKTRTEVVTGTGRKVKPEVKLTPILVPINTSTTFFQNIAGDTKVRIHDTEYEITESLKEVCDFIAQSLFVVNQEALNKFFPSGEEDV